MSGTGAGSGIARMARHISVACGKGCRHAIKLLLQCRLHKCLWIMTDGCRTTNARYSSNSVRVARSLQCVHELQQRRAGIGCGTPGAPQAAVLAAASRGVEETVQTIAQLSHSQRVFGPKRWQGVRPLDDR